MKRVTEKKLARWNRQAEAILKRTHALLEEIEAAVDEADPLSEHAPLLEYAHAATIALDEFVTVASVDSTC
jgi:hypothetical protein